MIYIIPVFLFVISVLLMAEAIKDGHRSFTMLEEDLNQDDLVSFLSGLGFISMCLIWVLILGALMFWQGRYIGNLAGWW